MTRYLLPRLHQSPAAAIWDSRLNHSLEELYAAADIEHELQIFAPTGGTRIRGNELAKLAAGVRMYALDAGYPSIAKAEYRNFDSQTAAWLVDSWPGFIGEALRSDTWAFLSTVLLPDVVAWRWSRRTPERLYGPLIRNGLGRLWLHGTLLQRNGAADVDTRWELLQNASEDFLMNLVERTSLSANEEFARAIAEEWLTWRNRVSPSVLEALHRSALKRLRLLTVTVEPAVLDAEQRQGLIAEAFQLSYQAMTSQQ